MKHDEAMSDEPALYLHEFIDIVGQHQWDYMEHAKAQAGHEKVDFELFGTWYTMGITGRWPQVVNIWDIPGGWDGWAAKVDRLGMKRMSNAHLEGWWEKAYTYRTGGFDRLLAGVRAARRARRSRPTACAARCSCTSSPRFAREARATTSTPCSRSARR